MKRYSLLLVLLVILSACLAPPIKPPAQPLSRIGTVLVVAVEAPPLEVIPDPIETRLPVYRQSEFLPFDRYIERKIYRSPGGVLVAGLLSPDESVPEALPARTLSPADDSASLEPAASLGENWMPTVVLAREAASRLTTAGFKARQSASYYRLPIALGDRTANLVRWREAVRQWYNRDVSPVDYGAHGVGRGDAVLEVGIGTYGIFDVQTPLQVLVKLIDPVTRRVIGRTAVDAYPVRGSAQTLLDHEADSFKRQLAETGAQLVAHGLSELGLP